MEQDLDPRKGTARGGLFPLPFHLPFDFLKNHPHMSLEAALDLFYHSATYELIREGISEYPELPIPGQ